MSVKQRVALRWGVFVSERDIPYQHAISTNWMPQDCHFACRKNLCATILSFSLSPSQRHIDAAPQEKFQWSSRIVLSCFPNEQQSVARGEQDLFRAGIFLDSLVEWVQFPRDLVRLPYGPLSIPDHFSFHVVRARMQEQFSSSFVIRWRIGIEIWTVG